MIVHDVKLGSTEWVTLRLGRPTASRFGEILTPKKLAYAAGAVSYRYELLTEWITAQPKDDFVGGWTEYGNVEEDRARAWYATQVDEPVRAVGFITTDDGRFGCSPDGLVGERRGLELKCPAPHNHMAHLLDRGAFVEKYKGQVQGGLFVTGLDAWDLVSYNTGLPPVKVEVEPDDEYQKALKVALERFDRELREDRATLRALGLEGWAEKLEATK